MRPRGVAVFTASRAEYGLQYPVLRAVQDHPALRALLIVSSAHLTSGFGSTVDEIERDGLRVDAQVPMPVAGDNPAATAHAIGVGIQGIGKALVRLEPDFLIVHGDRYEALAAAIAGTQMNIPTAHIEGGDRTDGGAHDDSIRHAITKLAHLHFPSNAEASDRIRRLGEEDWRIQTVGLPTIDLIRQRQFAPPDELSERFGLDVTRPLVVFTQHSVATEFEEAGAQVRPSVEALEALADTGVQVLITYPNQDAGGRRIVGELEKLSTRARQGIQIHASLGRHVYHGLLDVCGRHRGVCVGNSSSGIKETPAFGCPTVNIGARQRNRLRAQNVIDVGYDRDAILAALRKGLNDEGFRHECRNVENPYGQGNAGERIAATLASVELGSRLLQKQMSY